MKAYINFHTTKLENLTEAKIKAFAGDVIFGRGYDYYSDDLVEDFELDPEKKKLSAVIRGNFGVYLIKISQYSGEINAECNCPFDGYPCKHIVAVLLYYLNNKEVYVKSLQEAHKNERQIKRKLLTLKKEQLINIIFSFSKKYPAAKRDLYLQLNID